MKSARNPENPKVSNASQPRDIHAQRILIMDFGSQWTQLIARRVREIGVYLRDPLAGYECGGIA